MFTDNDIHREIQFYHYGYEMDNKITNIINNLFVIFDNKTNDEIIDMLPGTMKRCAIDTATRGHNIKNYILAEILECAGNIDGSRKRKIITPYYIIKGIKNDNELSMVFNIH